MIPTDPRIANLPGAKRCRHDLLGNGETHAEFEARTGAPVDGYYAAQAYRHHVYVPQGSASLTGEVFCVCGNLRDHIVHRPCVTLLVLTDAAWRETKPADREAVAKLLGLVDDPDAHGRHKPMKRTMRIRCGARAYKMGFAPCELGPELMWNDE